MNIDEIKNIWAEHDRKLDRLIQVNVSAMRELRVTRTRSSLQRLAVGIAIELAIAAIAILWLGNFIAGHPGEPAFLVPALLVDLASVAFAASCIRQLAAIGGLEYSRPVVDVQRALERLRILRIRTTKWSFVAGCLLWAPLLVVFARGAAGIDLYRIAAIAGASDPNVPAWIIANMAFGLALALIVVWISKRFGSRLSASPLLKGLLDDIAGRSLTDALQSLDALAQFETEGGTDTAQTA
jgi:hypothetical protein